MVDIVPFDDRDGFIWYNGKFVNWRDAKVHVLNHGLHYCSCVFEGMRVYNNKVFKLTEHNERLHKSAELLGYKIPYSVAELDKVTNELIKKQGVVDGYVRPFAFRGSEKMAISAQNNKIHVAIATWPWPPYYTDEAKKKGIRMTIADYKRPSPETAPSASKAAGLYMICTISKHKAEDEGYNEALMYDWRGFIAEATSANFFMVVNGELHTPLADCFLDGITRRTVIDIAKKNNIKVVERRIKPEELATAQEAFLTGTAAELTPIASIADYKFTIGKVTNLLMDEYTKLVRS